MATWQYIFTRQVSFFFFYISLYINWKWIFLKKSVLGNWTFVFLFLCFWFWLNTRVTLNTSIHWVPPSPGKEADKQTKTNLPLFYFRKIPNIFFATPSYIQCNSKLFQISMIEFVEKVLDGRNCLQLLFSYKLREKFIATIQSY